jgi:hypothetical protein
MAKKNTGTTARLEAVEGRLRRVEELLSQGSVVMPLGMLWLRCVAVQPGLPSLLPLEVVSLTPEIKEKRRQMRETPVEPWQHLVQRQHPWRKQLYFEGRNLTARQLVGAMKANQLDETTAAANYKLPVEAVREAVAYVESNTELLATESEIERLMLKRGQGGVARGPQPVS